MQHQIAPRHGGHLTGNNFPDTAHIVEESRTYLDAEQRASLMELHGYSRTGRTIPWDKHLPGGRPHAIDFALCSYLGLDNHPAIVAGAIQAIEAQRALHWSGARTRLNFDLLGALEECLSDIFRARVLTFSSGMLANLGAMPILASGQLTSGKKPVVVFDRSAHVSLAYHKPMVADETRVETIEHNDIDALESLCRENPVVAYVCDAVCPTGGCSPIKELRQLQERYGLFLYIDDAHGISIFGTQGEGFARSRFPQELGERTIIAASLAKGFGASGGVLMVGDADHEALFRRHSVPYAFSMTPNLAAVGAALGSCKIHRSTELGQRQRRLAQRIELFDDRIATPEQGNSLPIRTIAIGSEASTMAIARGLFASGFYTVARFFSRAGQVRAGIQVCITAEHEVKDIARVCDEILKQVAEATGKPHPLR